MFGSSNPGMLMVVPGLFHDHVIDIPSRAAVCRQIYVPVKVKPLACALAGAAVKECRVIVRERQLVDKNCVAGGEPSELTSVMCPFVKLRAAPSKLVTGTVASG